MNQTRLLTSRAADGLPDPPGCIGSKVAATLIVKFLCRPHQAQVSLLNKINQGHSCASVAACNRNYQTQVTFNQPPASALVTNRRPLCQFNLFTMCQQPEAANVTEITLKSIFSSYCLLGAR